VISFAEADAARFDERGPSCDSHFRLE
jgi:hypothetical protein